MLSYCAPYLQVRPCQHKGGRGLFTQEPIRHGTLLALWCGDIIAEAEVLRLSEQQRWFALQIEETLHLAPPRALEPADYVNHSCAPNAGIQGQIGLVAMRDIIAGEEICYDYAMTESAPATPLRCQRGEHTCRQVVRHTDWMLPDLQQRYDGYFSLYLQRHVDQARTMPSRLMHRERNAV